MADTAVLNGGNIAKKNKKKKKRKNVGKGDGSSPDITLEHVDKYPKVRIV